MNLQRVFNKRSQHWLREEESGCDSSMGNIATLVSNVVVLIAEFVTFIRSQCVNFTTFNLKRVKRVNYRARNSRLEITRKRHKIRIKYI